MYAQQKYIMAARYIFLVLPVLGSLVVVPVSSYPLFILLFLILLANSRMRCVYFRDKLLIFSVIFECGLSVYMSLNYQGFIYLVLFSTMMDACMLLRKEPYIMYILLGIGLIYSVYKACPVEWVVIITVLYITELLFLLQLKKELAIRSDTEELYDRIRKYTYELEAARSRLLDYSRQVEKNAQLEERNRISRELHDSIGHSLTGILMQVDACMQVMEVDRDRGMEILKAIYDNINRSIETVRQTVRKMRPVEYRTNLEGINRLVEKFQNDTGVKISFNISGIPYQILPSIETALYRNIQEALTNAVRHGHADSIFIDMAYTSDSIRLIISNDGESPGTIKKGFGLSGIEERVALIGGTVEFSGDDGFKMDMVIPRGDTNGS